MASIVSLAAIVAGLIAAYRDAVLVASGRSRRSYVRWERFGLVTAIVCVPSAIFIIHNSLNGFGPIVLAMGLAQLVFGLAAILSFATRWRPLVEALAAVAIGVFSIITLFSIGILLTPFAIALGISAFSHSDPRMFSQSVIPESVNPTSSRSVDTPP
jgi:asparagine N-glycosylation enzyme membrane subunit Stt3